jgi:large subunit ribosomal protein L29
MAKAKIIKENLNALSMQDINDRIIHIESQLKKMKFSHAITPIENPLSIKSLRRQIARLQTAKRVQELAS